MDHNYLIDQIVREEREQRERFEPVPLQMPVHDDREQSPNPENEDGARVIVIDYGDDTEE